MIISGAIVLDPTYDNGNNPLIGWQNLVTIANVAAETTVAGYPASNLANPATYSEWQGTNNVLTVLNAPAATSSPGATFTYVDLSAAIPAGSTISTIGVYSATAGTFTLKIVKRNSAGNYDIVFSQAFAHPGGGWADIALSPAFTVPGSGSYYLGVANNTVLSGVNFANSSVRAFKAGDITGVGQSGFTEDATTPSLPPLRYILDQHLTVTLDGMTDFDYVAVAKHNFGSGRILVSVEVLNAGNWTEVIPAVMPGDDSPLLWRLGRQQGIGGFRIRMQSSATAPRCAVLYGGLLTVCERRMYVGHVPLPQGLQYSVTNGMSESGNFLGRIVTGAWRSSSIFFRLISPAWHRANTVPFLAAVKDTPFFFAWRPTDYPMEIGYCWLSGSPPVPVPVQADGNLIAFQLDVQGVA